VHYQETVVDNGVRVVSERMDSVRSVALGLWFKVGSRDEAAREAGLSHFMEHLMFKGTPTRDARQLSEAFDRLGAHQNAFTSKEATCYFANFIDESLPEVFALLADMVTASTFDQEACELERQVVIEEIARGEDDPEDLAHELFMRTLWPAHKLGRPIAGTRDVVGGFGQADARAYHAKHYTAENCVVAAAGNVDHEALVELAQAYLGALPAAREPHLRTSPPGAFDARAFQYKDTEQAHLLYGTTTIPAGDDARFALTLLNTVFGGTMSSRLFQEVREKLGLVYAIYSMPQLYEGGGAYAVYAGTRPENGQQVAELIAAEFDTLARAGLRADELELARMAAKGTLALGLESTSKRMMRLAERILIGKQPLSFDESLARLEAVSLNEVNDFAAALGASPRVLSVVGPYSNDEWTV
jgi:predicted Zn-dependent peptidase